MNSRPSPNSRVTAARLAVACVLALLGSAPTAAATRLSSMDEFNAGKARADAELRADRAACDQLAGTPRDVCREQARAKELVARAELELAHTGSRQSHDRLATVRMDTTYDIARTQCNEQVGAAKAACTKAAQTARAQAQAEMKRGQGETDAPRLAEDRRDTEKCHATAADPRTACMAAAKAGKR